MHLHADDYDRSHGARGYERVDCSTRRRVATSLYRSSRAIRGMRRRHAEVVPNEQSESERAPPMRERSHAKRHSMLLNTEIETEMEKHRNQQIITNEEYENLLLLVFYCKLNRNNCYTILYPDKQFWYIIYLVKWIRNLKL